MPSDDASFDIVSLTAGSFNIRIAVPRNPEFYFNELLKKSPDHPDHNDEKIPYWCELWPSSIALAGFIADNADMFKGRRILEIGCGLGLSGIVAGLAGGVVTLSDYMEDALAFAGKNWQMNLDSKPNLLKFDWRHHDDAFQSDVLIASDIAYESKSFKPLIKSLGKLITRDGLIVISEPNRKFAGKFFDALGDHGFAVAKETRQVFWNNVENTITIHLLRKSL